MFDLLSGLNYLLPFVVTMFCGCLGQLYSTFTCMSHRNIADSFTCFLFISGHYSYRCCNRIWSGTSMWYFCVSGVKTLFDVPLEIFFNQLLPFITALFSKVLIMLCRHSVLRTYSGWDWSLSRASSSCRCSVCPAVFSSLNLRPSCCAWTPRWPGN